jgi:hypothetical protein
MEIDPSVFTSHLVSSASMLVAFLPWLLIANMVGRNFQTRSGDGGRRSKVRIPSSQLQSHFDGSFSNGRSALAAILNERHFRGFFAAIFFGS